ncbi:hypothetical protein ACFSKN_15255 [Mariniflexile gromovii]|uniref:Uncharacterized protein n=1 Tax=Mariniflexile gromovii TaxID=362523 RepID=A0ABS4BZ09_9FLAO|nr:hypothetical protein [Mariniflexile gromovii]MBP0905819.1 hypothetical protein [Mariniflexile gromovii]
MREQFLIENLLESHKSNLVYSHYERWIAEEHLDSGSKDVCKKGELK